MHKKLEYVDIERRKEKFEEKSWTLKFHINM